MRSSQNPDLFFEKMKKKPALQAILDNFDNYTVDDLKNLVGQPLWIRESLVRRKERGGRALTPDELADMMTTPAALPPGEFTFLQWTSGDGWIGRNAARFWFEIRPNDLILILNPNEIVVGHSHIKIDHQSYQVILQNSQRLGVATLSVFKRLYAIALTKKHQLTT